MRLAHRMRERFPDGMLHADLPGSLRIWRALGEPWAAALCPAALGAAHDAAGEPDEARSARDRLREVGDGSVADRMTVIG
ncbi:hypothetical protein [Actinoplanes sp. G11-F43]|uniref:hypothetical protein n=1 Tax=Actinoplanes sp. G11-F43 TaxID=3424130 RepID=UPI003D343536